MNCEAVKEMLWAYLEKETTVEETVKIEEHLKYCADCREELKLQKEWKKTLADLPVEELPEGYHAELMQKLQAEAAPNVVPFPARKKKQPVWKQWGMVAAAVLVVVAAGGMNGMLEMRENQSDAVREMKAAANEDHAGASMKDESVVVESADVIAEQHKETNITYKKMTVPVAGAETSAVTPQDQTKASYDLDAAMPQAASFEAEEGAQFFTTRSTKPEATDKATLLVADAAVVLTELQKAIAEADGFEEAADVDSIVANIPLENYDAFVKAMESIGILNWTQKGNLEADAAYCIVEINLQTK